MLQKKKRHSGWYRTRASKLFLSFLFVFFCFFLFFSCCRNKIQVDRSLGSRRVPLFVDRPRCSGSWPVWTRRTVTQLCCRTFRRQRHWYVHGWFFWLRCTSRCVFAWPKMLRIMAGIQSSRPRSSSTTVACSWSVLLVTMLLALCSFFLVVRPKMLGIMAGLDQKDSCLEEYRKTGLFST